MRGGKRTINFSLDAGPRPSILAVVECLGNRRHHVVRVDTVEMNVLDKLQPRRKEIFALAEFITRARGAEFKDPWWGYNIFTQKVEIEHSSAKLFLLNPEDPAKELWETFDRESSEVESRIQEQLNAHVSSIQEARTRILGYRPAPL